MDIAARPAIADDIGDLTRLYRALEREMGELESTWSLADGLPEPIGAAFRAALSDADSVLLVGTIDSIPFGFLLGRRERTLPQAQGVSIGAIRLVFTEPEARGVGVGEAMVSRYLRGERALGIGLFDAHVAPGHRLAKNFFESHGFSARRIVMHRVDEAE